MLKRFLLFSRQPDTMSRFNSCLITALPLTISGGDFPFRCRSSRLEREGPGGGRRQRTEGETSLIENSKRRVNWGSCVFIRGIIRTSVPRNYSAHSDFSTVSFLGRGDSALSPSLLCRSCRRQFRAFHPVAPIALSSPGFLLQAS